MKTRILQNSMTKWAVLSVIILLSACSEAPEPTSPPKTNPPITGDPGPDPIGEAPIMERMEGKWLIGEVTFMENLRIKKLNSPQVFQKKSGRQIEITGVNSRVSDEGTQAFLEIFEGGSYFLYDGKEAFYRGMIQEVESEKWDLEGFGSMENVKSKNNELHFQLTQKNVGTAITVEAKQVQKREGNQKTTYLCQEWYYQDYLSSAGEVEDLYPIGEIIDIYQNNQPVDSGVLQPDEYMDVEELTESKLVFSDQIEDEDGHNQTEKLIFKSGERFIEDRNYLDEDGMVKLPFRYNFLNSKPYDFDFEESSFVLKGIKFSISDLKNDVSCDLASENITMERPYQYGLPLMEHLIIDLGNFPTVNKLTVKIFQNCGIPRISACAGNNEIHSEIIEENREGQYNNIVTYSLPLKDLNPSKLFISSCEAQIYTILIE